MKGSQDGNVPNLPGGNAPGTYGRQRSQWRAVVRLVFAIRERMARTSTRHRLHLPRLHHRQLTGMEGYEMNTELFGSDDYANACADCGQNFTEAGTIVSSGAVCPDCADDYVSCRRCDEMTHTDYIGGYNRDGNAICDACHARDYTYCVSCEVSVRDGYYNVIADACNRCASELGSDCESCGEWVSFDWGYSNSRGYFCEYCYREESPEGIHEYHAGAPWGIEFISQETADSDELREYVSSAVHFGVEFEMEGYSSDVAAITSVSEMNHDAHAELDSSVEGIEFISQPATLEAWRGRYGARMAEYLRGFRGEGFTAGAADCGAHVHVSRTAFADDSHLARFATFFVHNPEFVTELSGRDSVEQWASVEKYRAGALRDEVKGRFGDRYRAVNLRNSATVEIRIFAGTDEFAETLGQIEFISALVEFTRELPISAIMSGALLADNFTAWIADNRAQFPNAVALMITRTELGRGELAA